MPVFEPRNELGQLDEWSVSRLLAVMAHPSDESERQRYLARLAEHIHASVEEASRQEVSEELRQYPEGAKILVTATAEHLGKTLTRLGGFAALAGAPGYRELNERLLNSFWPGSVTGDMLTDILQLDAHGHGGSVRKAVVLAQDFLSTATTLSGEASRGASKRFVQESWSRFKSVAHFWAAYRVWFFKSLPYDDNESNPSSPLCPFRVESLPGFLAVTAEFLRLGTEHYAHGQRNPTLNPAHSWTLPSDLPLPDAAVTFPEPEPRTLEVLADYKPKI